MVTDMTASLRRTVPAAIVLAAAIVAAQAPSAPPPPPTPQEGPNVTFRVEVNYVEVDARVLDTQGNFVRDLDKEDFQILEDGAPQAVTTFALINIPVERPEVPLFAREPIESDVATNARDFDGRLYLFVLDDLHTNPLRTSLVKAAARRFIEAKLGANDKGAVMTTSGMSDANQEFTGNRRLLLRAVDHFMGRKLRSATLGQLQSYGSRFTDPEAAERGYHADSALRTLKNVADFLAGVRGRRKALVYVSEGIDYDIHDVFNNRDASRLIEDAREAVAAASRSNVSIYAIDPRGLTALGDDVVEIAGLGDDPRLGLGPRSLQRELQLAQDNLRMLAEETGGFAVVNTNDFATAFDRIVAENSSYYLLGYYATNNRRDGRRRKIDVRVRRPGLQVRARNGYVEARGRAQAPAAPRVAGLPAALDEAVTSPLPLSGLTLSATVAAFKGEAPNASVSIVMEARGSDLHLNTQNGKYAGKLELSAVAVDRDGKVKRSGRSTVSLDLRPETFARVNEFGIRFLSRLELPAGRYQLRLGALSTESGARGSVFYDLEVPDFRRGPMTMSGLLVTSASAGRVPTGQPDAQIADVLPSPPTTQREFPIGDEIAAFAEVYDNQLSPPHMVDITTNVLTDEGRVVFTNTESRSSTELQGKAGGYGYTTRIPLKGFAPGLYVLKVEAHTRTGQNEPITRQVQFRIRNQ
jgi:VWFA-related protein